MKTSLLIAFATVLFLAVPQVRAASDYLLEIDGVKGESTDEVHPETVEILSFSWGATNVGGASGGGGGAGKVSLQDFHFTTRLSKASPQLLVACATGRHIPKAVLFVRKSGGGGQDYYKITLTDVLVSSYSQSGQGGGDPRPTESLSLNFAKIEVEYTADDGSVTAGEAQRPSTAP